MMLLGSRCRIVVLLVTLGSGARAHEAPPGTDCDFACKLQAYLATDHMVRMVPIGDAGPAEPRPARKPKPAPRRVATKPVDQAPPSRGPHRAQPATATMTASGPAPAAAPSAAPSPSSLPRPAPASPSSPAGRAETLIPGSAPMMATQFEMPAGR